MEHGTCAHCGEAFPYASKNRTWQRYCSPRRAQAYKRKHRKPIKVCNVCGQAYRADRTTSRYCSSACWGVAGGKARRLSNEELRRRQNNNALVSEMRRLSRLVERAGSHLRQCSMCGQWFLAYPRQRELCSQACRRLRNREVWNTGKQVRRARKRNAPRVERVYRVRIFKRDGYRCQLCGKRLQMDKQVPHPKAPTLDHVVPLSLGGDHTPANVQAAHFLCNSKKHVTPSGEQLRLV